MKLLRSKVVLMVLGLMLGVGAALGVTLAFGESLGITGKPGETKIKYVEKPKFGMMMPMRERIVNLADPGVMRYLKATIVLEMVDSELKELPKGEEYKHKQDELKKEMGGTLPADRGRAHRHPHRQDRRRADEPRRQAEAARRDQVTAQQVSGEAQPTIRRSATRSSRSTSATSSSSK